MIRPEPSPSSTSTPQRTRPPSSRASSPTTSLRSSIRSRRSLVRNLRRPICRSPSRIGPGPKSPAFTLIDGATSARVSGAQDLAKKFLVEQQSELSNTRDADLTSAAIQLSQATTQQQASLTAQAKISKLSLFDYLA